MNDEFFPPKPEIAPPIYAYELPGVPSHKGYLKVGYTEQGADARVRQQLQTAGLADKARIVVRESAMRPDGSVFSDKEVHRRLEARGCPRMNCGALGDRALPVGADRRAARDRNEWFLCTEWEVRAAIREARERTWGAGARDLSFGMRPEQREAVDRTAAYFREARKADPDRTPKYLWNAKMRFGKTFAAYQLAKKLKWRKVLVLTFKPAVESAWQEDLERHVDFEGWSFVSDKVAAATGPARGLRPQGPADVQNRRPTARRRDAGTGLARRSRPSSGESPRHEHQNEPSPPRRGGALVLMRRPWA